MRLLCRQTCLCLAPGTRASRLRAPRAEGTCSWHGDGSLRAARASAQCGQRFPSLPGLCPASRAVPWRRGRCGLRPHLSLSSRTCHRVWDSVSPGLTEALGPQCRPEGGLRPEKPLPTRPGADSPGRTPRLRVALSHAQMACDRGYAGAEHRGQTQLPGTPPRDTAPETPGNHL